MWVFLGFTAGMCLFIVLWATGLAQDAAGIAALGILGVGVLAQMARQPQEQSLLVKLPVIESGPQSDMPSGTRSRLAPRRRSIGCRQVTPDKEEGL